VKKKHKWTKQNEVGGNHGRRRDAKKNGQKRGKGGGGLRVSGGGSKVWGDPNLQVLDRQIPPKKMGGTKGRQKKT